MALPSPPNYTYPIPNNPFLSPETFYVAGPQGCVIVGTGLYIDFPLGTINSSGGGGGGAVSAITAGPGIAISSSTGNVTICNNGVVNLTGTLPVVIGGTPGAPDVALAPSGVVPGVYTVPTIDVDVYGRILSATAGALPTASTTVAGIVRLATIPEVQAGTDNTTAITPLGAYSTYIPLACVAAKGSLIAGVAASSPFPLPVGTDGQVLTADSTCLTGLKWASGGGGGGGAVTSVTGIRGYPICVSPASGTGDVCICVLEATTNYNTGVLFGCTSTVRQNVALGRDALGNSGFATTESFNTAIGYASQLNSVGCSNTSVGHRSLSCNNQCGNTAVGASAMEGYRGGFACFNTAVGYYALSMNPPGSGTGTQENTAIGVYALRTGSSGLVGGNTHVGACSGEDSRGTFNTAIGRNSLKVQGTGQENVAVGNEAMFGSSVTSTASWNTAVGASSMATVRGCFNVAIGYCSLSRLTTGCYNTAIGSSSGDDALCTITTQSNHVILGNNTTTNLVSKVPLTVPSDLRWKKVAGDVPLALPFVESLSPIKYQFCDKETGEVTDDRYRYGFSAQEILANEENPEHPIIVGIDNPDMYSVSETMLFPILVNAIKELSAQNKKLEERLAKLEEK